MTTTYHYVVLRLATDDLRGEIINVGVILFEGRKKAQPIVMAPLNKLRALDSTWDLARLNRWSEGLDRVIASETDLGALLRVLGRFGYVDPDAVGMFTASSAHEVTQNIREIKATYVSNKADSERQPRDKRTRLQTSLRDQFKRMHVLGGEVGDLANHLVVQNVPVPGHPELKSDFVFKNGVYRLTQTLDYNVAPDSLHNKLMEACVKSTAAEMALKDYGSDALRLAVLDIPEQFADAADPHINLLIAKGFEIFHFGDAGDMADYLKKATPQSPSHLSA